MMFPFFKYDHVRVSVTYKWLKQLYDILVGAMTHIEHINKQSYTRYEQITQSSQLCATE